MYDLQRALVRLALSLLVGTATIWASRSLGWPLRIVATWNAVSGTELVLAWYFIASSGVERTRRWAQIEDPGRAAATSLVVCTSFVALFVAMYMLHNAGSLPATVSLVRVGLCLGAVLSSWLLTHTTYTGLYARHYYRHGGGLQFPGDASPSYWDFAYFAFTIGMCFQVSDVVVSTSRLRRAVFSHALISFTFNTALLALALNLVAGLWG